MHMTSPTSKRSISWTYILTQSKKDSQHLGWRPIYVAKSPYWQKHINRIGWCELKLMPIGQLITGRVWYSPMSQSSCWLAQMDIHGAGEAWQSFRWAIYKEGGKAWWWECDGLGLPNSQWGGSDLLALREIWTRYYNSEILDDEFLGTLCDLEINKKDIYFQQDNDPKHTSNLVTDWFQKKEVDKLRWPPNSPDMSIIKNLWDYLDKKIWLWSPLLTNLHQMWAALVEEWGNIEKDYIEKLYESTKGSCIIGGKGWPYKVLKDFFNYVLKWLFTIRMVWGK